MWRERVVSEAARFPYVFMRDSRIPERWWWRGGGWRGVEVSCGVSRFSYLFMPFLQADVMGIKFFLENIQTAKFNWAGRVSMYAYIETYRRHMYPHPSSPAAEN